MHTDLTQRLANRHNTPLSSIKNATGMSNVTSAWHAARNATNSRWQRISSASRELSIAAAKIMGLSYLYSKAGQALSLLNPPSEHTMRFAVDNLIDTATTFANPVLVYPIKISHAIGERSLPVIKSIAIPVIDNPYNYITKGAGALLLGWGVKDLTNLSLRKIVTKVNGDIQIHNEEVKRQMKVTAAAAAKIISGSYACLNYIPLSLPSISIPSITMPLALADSIENIRKAYVDVISEHPRQLITIFSSAALIYSAGKDLLSIKLSNTVETNLKGVKIKTSGLRKESLKVGMAIAKLVTAFGIAKAVNMSYGTTPTP